MGIKRLRKTSFLLAVTGALGWAATTHAQNQNCVNAAFELGNFTNWTGATGSCCPINTPSTGIVGGRHTIVSLPGADPVTGNALQLAPGGNYTTAARIGNSGTGAQAEALRYNMNINPNGNNALLIYNYAVVLEDPGHSTADQPRFDMGVRDQNGNLIACTYYQVTAGGSIPGFQNYGGVRWKNWTQVGVDLAGFNNVTIEARTGDCDLGGHFGYGYLVADCAPRVITVDYCQGDTLATLTAPPGFASYLWSTNQTSQSISLTNPAPGTYSCQITSVTGCVANLQTQVAPIQVTTNFASQGGCSGFVQLTDGSTITQGQVSQWNWNFGFPGGTSTQQNPNVNFPAPGTYNVSLVSQNNIGCKDTIQQQVVIPPFLNPQFLPPTGCGLTQSFIDASSISSGGTITNYFWNFGDNNTSTQQSPTHTYTNAGTYNVQLILTSADNCLDTITTPLTLYSIPNAAFQTPITCDQNAVQFTDQSTNVGGPLTNFDWNFGVTPPATGTGPNPTFVYPGPGNYPATLVVTGPGGCRDTVTQFVQVAPNPVTSFVLPDTCGLSGQYVSTSTISSGFINGYAWDFGGQGQATTATSNYTFAQPGSWNIRLITTSNLGCSDTLVRPYNNYTIPVADFTANNVCFGLNTDFTDQSTISFDNITNWSWSYGTTSGDGSTTQSPSFQYPTHGTYQVQLIASTNAGCADTIVQSVTVHPLPVPDFSVNDGCRGDTVSFVNNSTIPTGTITNYLWNFGTQFPAPSTATTPDVIYADAGNYNVTLYATSNEGCIDSITKPLEVHPKPFLAFQGGPLQGCAPLFVDFTDSTAISAGSVSSIIYNFGDNSSGIGSSLDHNYTTPGAFNVSVTATSSEGCDTTVTRLSYVIVYPTPIISFDADLECLGVPLNMNNTTTIPFGNVDTWAWDFGNGSTSGAQNPTITYDTAGTYTITLIASTNQGCADTLSEQVTVLPIPDIDFNFTIGCFRAVDFEALLLSEQIDEWQWNLGNNSPILPNQQFQYTYPQAGSYTVTLTGIYGGGCTNQVSKSLNVENSVPLDSLVLPNVITPNGDGVNDVLDFDNKFDECFDYSLLIYNRWGNLVFSTEKAGPAFGGVAADGSVLNDGTYFYVIFSESFKRSQTLNIFTNN